MAKVTVNDLSIEVEALKGLVLDQKEMIENLVTEVKGLKSALTSAQADLAVLAKNPTQAQTPAIQAQTPATQEDRVLSAIRALVAVERAAASPARRQFLAGRLLLAAGWEGALPPDRLGQVAADAAYLVKKAQVEEHLQPRAAAKLEALAKSLM